MSSLFRDFFVVESYGSHRSYPSRKRACLGGKIIPRIRLISAKDLDEVDAELGNFVVLPITLKV